MAGYQNKVVLGKVALIDRGTYDKTKTYDHLDMVVNGYSAYYSKKAGNKGNALPTTVEESNNSEWWGYLANGDLASQAAENATKATAKATDSTDAANKAAANAQEAAVKATTAKTDCEEATTNAKQAVTEVEDKIAETQATADELLVMAKQLAQIGIIAPTAIEVEYLSTITTKNKVANQRILVKLIPSTTVQSYIIQREDGDSLRCDPSGNLTVKGLGETTFYAISTHDSNLWKKVVINVANPRLRKTSSGALRLSNVSKLRVC